MARRLSILRWCIQAILRAKLFEFDQGGLLGLGQMSEMAVGIAKLSLLENGTAPTGNLRSFCHDLVYLLPMNQHGDHACETFLVAVRAAQQRTHTYLRIAAIINTSVYQQLCVMLSLLCKTKGSHGTPFVLLNTSFLFPHMFISIGRFCLSRGGPVLLRSSLVKFPSYHICSGTCPPHAQRLR